MKQFIEEVKSNKIYLILLVSLTLLVYFNVIDGAFTMADDIPGIINDPKAHDMGLAFADGRLNIIMNALQWHIGGGKPYIFHIVSIILHLLNTIISFYISKEFLDRRKAMLASILFLIHPMVSEPVMWISGQVYLQNALFQLLSIYLYIKGRSTNNKKILISSGIVFGIGVLLSRNVWFLIVPMMVTVLELFYFNKKINKKVLKKSLITLLPILIPSILFLLLTFTTQFKNRTEDLTGIYRVDTERVTPVLNRAPYIIGTISKLFVYPKDLTIYHEGEPITILSYKLMSIYSIIIVTLLLLGLRKRNIYAILGTLILVSLSPSFSPVVVAWFVAERYVYIGTFIFSIIVIKFLTDSEKKLKINNLTPFVFGVLLILASIRTFARTYDFKTNKNLWISTQKVSTNSPRAYNNLGDVYSTEGKFEQAAENFKMAAALDPLFAEAYYNLGLTYVKMNELELAKQSFSQALEILPSLSMAQEMIDRINEEIVKRNQAL